MRNSLLILLIIGLLFSCKEFANEKSLIENKTLQIEKIIIVDSTEKEPDESKFDIDKHLDNYNNLKKRIALKRSKITNNTNINSEEKIQLAERYVSTILIDSIFEYWAGTTWDFNGFTETPRKGDVACGYYVSTPLRDIGLKINRYKVAQKAASDIIKELCDNTTIKNLNGFNEVKAHLTTLENNEIVIVGLDFHVGFIYKRKSVLYFAHSNYIDREGVMKELLNESMAFKNSERYVIGKLTKSPEFLKKWLNNN